VKPAQPIATTTVVTAPARPSFAAGTTMAAIQAKGKLVVGTRFAQTGFGVKNATTGVLEGFDVEIAKFIAVGIFGGTTSSVVDKIDFQEVEMANREAAIRDGRVDIVVTMYPITDARKVQIDFAGPYFMAGQDLMVKTGDTSIKGITDLNGKKVCLTRVNPFTEPNVRAKAPQAELTVVDTAPPCDAALTEGRADAVASSNAVLIGRIDQSGGAFRLVGNPSTNDEPYGIGLKRGDDAFRSLINDRLEKVYSDGQWASAYAATLGKYGLKTPTPPPVDRYVTAAAVTSTSRP
jgi:glutamate transport system substrate-binding protein